MAHTDNDALGDGGQRLIAFLNAIHGNNAAGVIELRLIEDKPRGAPVDRRWFESPEQLVSALPELLALSAERGAAIYFGVLRRRANGAGKSADCIAGAAVWADLDFKDFDGDEGQARKSLEAFPVAPSVVIRSGRGLHVYWILREPAEPEELSLLSKTVALAVGGDHTHDAARILRLPGSYHRKDPANPILVEFELFEPDRACNPGDLRDAAEALTPVDALANKSSHRRAKPDAAERPPSVSDALPPEVAALMHRKRIGLLFNGEGKPELGKDGVPLDRSSSGYDFSLVIALAKAGVRDSDTLVSTLWHRPDGSARDKGLDYITRTVRGALDTVETAEQEAMTMAVDFEVERVRIFASNPARFEFTIDGVTFTLSSGQLRSPRNFALAYMDAAHRLPCVPTKAEVWGPMVNNWLASAEKVEMPPEASDEEALREAIARGITELPVGDVAEDLDHGKAVELADGVVAFKVQAILQLLRDDYPMARRGDVCRVLRSTGHVNCLASVQGTAVRIWRLESRSTQQRA